MGLHPRIELPSGIELPPSVELYPGIELAPGATHCGQMRKVRTARVRISWRDPGVRFRARRANRRVHRCRTVPRGLASARWPSQIAQMWSRPGAVTSQTSHQIFW